MPALNSEPWGGSRQECWDDAGIERIELCSNRWALIAGAGSRALNAVQQAEQQHETEKHNAALAHFISAGAISHFAFYRAWIRSERQLELTIFDMTNDFRTGRTCAILMRFTGMHGRNLSAIDGIG